jgi:hypothetical protein
MGYATRTLGSIVAPALLDHGCRRALHRVHSFAFAKGLIVISPTHSARLGVLMVALVCTLAWSAPGEAQFRYPPRYGYPVSADSSVRLEVTPRDAEVYVDGYYAGIVDDFDGVFQRLRVRPGAHEITLYRDGYRTARQSLYLTPDHTVKILQHLEPLGPGDAAEPRPVPTTPEAGTEAPIPEPRDRRRVPRGGYPPPPPNPNGPDSGPAPSAPDQSATGRLSIQLQPADAELLIDGQPWQVSQGQTSVVVDVAAGRHAVQARKQGYVGYLTEIDVQPGQTAPVTITLRTQP